MLNSKLLKLRKLRVNKLVQFPFMTVVLVVFGSIAGNGLQLGEVAEIEAQMFSFAQKFNRRTELELALNPPFCQTAVRRSLFYLFFQKFVFIYFWFYFVG